MTNTGANLTLLLDTHVLAWLASDSTRLPGSMRDRIAGAELGVSLVIAYEYADLVNRNRLPTRAPLDAIKAAFDIEIVSLPVDIWRVAANLPPIHRDPVDRMLIAHALASDLTIVTADADIHRYPVKTLW